MYNPISSISPQLFKAALEDMMDGEDQLLNATELRIIFGNLPPIYQVHCQMLETLKHASQNWTEEVSIGKIFLKFVSGPSQFVGIRPSANRPRYSAFSLFQAPDFEKAYPPFVNFFENTREELLRCDSAKPRFHAFLKARQTRPECGRQSLQELLIRPVQRLPSISLLLKGKTKIFFGIGESKFGRWLFHSQWVRTGSNFPRFLQLCSFMCGTNKN